MHRDPGLEKCQALPFGEHREFEHWKKWPWITPKKTMKVVGAIFSNGENIDKLNTELVTKNFYMELKNSCGMHRTILQKVDLVNCYMLLKL